ncbi:MAG: alpha/beta hydrolase [Anaerolineales bacterium]
MKTVTFLLIFFTLAACAEQPGLMTAPVPSPTRPAEPLTSETEITQSAGIETVPVSPLDVQIQLEDGLTISGTFHPAGGEPPWPAILLLHMLGGNRGQWDKLVPELTSSGYAVLAIDLRGHGETGGEADWEKTKSDIPQVLNYLYKLPYIASERVALAGASIGANLSLAAAANQTEIPTIVLLSPGLDYRGVTTLDALEKYGGRPLLLAASSEDAYAADSTRALAENASGEAELLIYDGAGHGTQMLEHAPGLPAAILTWLDRFLK